MAAEGRRAAEDRMVAAEDRRAAEGRTVGDGRAGGIRKAETAHRLVEERRGPRALAVRMEEEEERRERRAVERQAVEDRQRSHRCHLQVSDQQKVADVAKGWTRRRWRRRRPGLGTSGQ